MSINSISQFLTEKEVAQMLRIATSSLRKIRGRQEISFHRIGKEKAGRVVYSTEDVARFIQRSKREIAAEAA